MRQICAVCNISKKTHNHYSFFGIPQKDESVREKWNEILKCNLKINSFVCERHFNEDAFYETHFYAETANGVVLLNVKKRRKKLRPNAEPIPLDDVLSRKRNNDESESQKNSYTEQITNRVSSKHLKSFPEGKENLEQESLPSLNKESFIEITSSPVKRQLFPQLESPTPLTVPAKISDGNDRNLELDDRVIECSNSYNLENQNIDNNSITDAENKKSKYLRLIESVYNGSCVIELPNSKWNFIKGSNNEINFCMTNTYYEKSEDSSFMVAEMSKQLYLDEKKVLLILRNEIVPENSNLLPENKPTDKDSLELMLCNIDSYLLCIGGPSLNRYQRTSLNCARKDPPVWRHLDCKLVVTEANSICTKCYTLDKSFGQKIDRSIRSKNRKAMLTRNKFNAVKLRIT